MRTVWNQQVRLFINKELSIIFGDSAIVPPGSDKMLSSVANISVLGYYCFFFFLLCNLANCTSSWLLLGMYHIVWIMHLSWGVTPLTPGVLMLFAEITKFFTFHSFILSSVPISLQFTFFCRGRRPLLYVPIAQEWLLGGTLSWNLILHWGALLVVRIPPLPTFRRHDTGGVTADPWHALPLGRSVSWWRLWYPYLLC